MNKYSKEELEYFIKNYSDMTNTELSKILNKKRKSLINKAYELGLKKTDKILSQVVREGWSDKRSIETSIKYKERLRKHIDIQKVIELYNSGKGLHETSRISGASAPTTRKILVEHNILIRKADQTGERNSFWKHKHTDETKKKIGRPGESRATPHSRQKQCETMIKVNRMLGKHFGSTSLEKTVKKFLESIGLKENIDFVYNKILNTNPGFVFPDFRIESKKLCIEADGEHWHSDPIREELRDNRIRKLGYNIIHLTGKEIDNGDFKCKLLKVLNC